MSKYNIMFLNFLKTLLGCEPDTVRTFSDKNVYIHEISLVEHGMHYMKNPCRGCILYNNNTEFIEDTRTPPYSCITRSRTILKKKLGECSDVKYYKKL